MRRFNSTITAAQSIGTTFYYTTLSDVIQTLKDKSQNEILIFLLETRGWYALDFEHNLFGSYVDGDDLYLCVTDGAEIEIDGVEVYPEDAIEEFGVDAIKPWLESATDDVITFRITEYELRSFDIDDVALNMLNEGYHFVDIADAAEDMEII